MNVSRRRFVQGAGLAGLGLLGACGQVPGQAAPAKVHRVGWLALASANTSAASIDAFRQGMRDYGYVEGQNLIIEARYADGSPERAHLLATELVRMPVELIAVAGGPTVGAVRDATSAVPIVVGSAGDIIAGSYVTSLAHPDRNITGLTNPSAGPTAKRLQLLKEAAPGISLVALPWSATIPQLAPAYAETQQAAEVLGIQLRALDVSGPTPDFEGAFAIAAAERTDGVFTLADPTMIVHRERVVSLATKHRLPSMFPYREFVDAGGLMAYGPNFGAMHRRSAYYVDRILKSAKPADLPVEQPREFDFVINLRTAQALGLTIPPHVLLQATEIIQ
jgi:putative tryptophan/tyrosine transport system substrate-binding protein